MNRFMLDGSSVKINSQKNTALKAEMRAPGGPSPTLLALVVNGS